MVDAPPLGDLLGQRFAIRGRVWRADEAGIQAALGEVHGTSERPRCLCRARGVEMYVARLQEFIVKRMPDSGHLHHPSCPSFESEAAQSGLGALTGSAVRELETGRTELRVDFPWVRRVGRSAKPAIPMPSGQVEAGTRRMSLCALMQLLFDRAGFNRWSPAMAGRRRWGVIRKFLLDAAEQIDVAGGPLTDRLFVPEVFDEGDRAEAARRRREKLAILRPHDGSSPLALLIGEFKAAEMVEEGRRIWIRHMPDAPLLVDEPVWQRLLRRHAPLFEARDADLGLRVRLVMSALIRSRREFTYEIDTASLMMTSEQWIPIEGVHELPLIDALVTQGRRFLKPLRYDAPNAEAFANALLLDAGTEAVPLHLVSAYLDERARAAKQRAIARSARPPWVWQTDQPLPDFPSAGRSPG